MHRVPKHIAMIMDGNGRWAKERDLPRAEGHRRGAEAIERIVRACRDRGVRYLTLYAFSEENWRRPSEEVLALMQLLRHFLVAKRPEMIEEGTEFRAIGDLSRLPADVKQEIEETSEATKGGGKITLVVALSYGGRQEIVRAVNKLVRDGTGEIDERMISEALDTAEMPDPDLLVRTSGEYRVSNFLLWQIAYAELYITETLWPEFEEAELDKAIESYSNRERRFGMTDEQLG